MSASRGNHWWVYIIETDKGNLYTGITTDVDRRWQEHCASARGEPHARGAKFFRSQQPLAVVYCKPYPDRQSASQAEAAIKAMDRQSKLDLVRNAASP